MRLILRSPGALVLLVALVCLATRALHVAHADDPLPSWNDGPVKRAITTFVATVCDAGSDSYVQPPERVAVFDNDGTMWTEQPTVVELQFAIDRVRAIAGQHPEWQKQEPFRSILARDERALARLTEHDAAALLAATHSGLTTDQFDEIVRRWFETARHPRFKTSYELTAYQPMLELFDYLRSNGFHTYLVSGGGVDFMRAIATHAYGIAPFQIIGSSGKTQFQLRDGKAVLLKLPEVSSLDDGAGKPVNIHLHIGEQPIFAFGNSDGDLQMLQYTATRQGPHMALLLHHDDGAREYVYDRTAATGRLDKAWDAALRDGWLVVSMAKDWNRVFREESP